MVLSLVNLQWVPDHQILISSVASPNRLRPQLFFLYSFIIHPSMNFVAQHPRQFILYLS